jgi:hypothetical protein
LRHRGRRRASRREEATATGRLRDPASRIRTPGARGGR